MKLAKPDDPLILWPEGRAYHSTAVISDPLLLHQKRTVMIVLGGRKLSHDNACTLINDSWIYNHATKTWQQVYIVTLCKDHCLYYL